MICEARLMELGLYITEKKSLGEGVLSEGGFLANSHESSDKQHLFSADTLMSLGCYRKDIIYWDLREISKVILKKEIKGDLSCFHF